MSWLPRIESEFAGYRIKGLVGHGGMSVVYRAEHMGLGRIVALKILAPHLTEDQSFRERFVRESRMAASLEHPNIIPIYEAGDSDGVFFIAMRYVEGSDLKSIIRDDGPLDVHRAASVIGQVCAALSVAHARGLVHRDIKPANILIASGIGPEESDHVYVSDFGIAKQTREPALTKTGLFVGTADYASPEQIEGKEIDGRADIYSLGCVLYECLTGEMAYAKDSEVALMYAHLLEPPPSAREKREELPPAADAVIARAMAKSRDERYPTVRELAAAVRDLERPAAAEPAAAAAAPPVAPETVLAPATPPAGSETVLATSPGGASAQAAPPAAPPPPTDAASVPSPAAPAPPPAAQPRSRRTMWIVAAVVVGLAIVGGIIGAVIALTGGGGTKASSAPTTTPTATGSTQTGGFFAKYVPPELLRDCRTVSPARGAQHTLECTRTANSVTDAPNHWEVDTYGSDAALTASYEKLRSAHGVKRNFGRCDGAGWGGEGPWFHGPGKPGGRRFCYFQGNDVVIVWSHAKLGQATHTDTLGIATKADSDHPGLSNWWRFWRHRIGKTS